VQLSFHGDPLLHQRCVVSRQLCQHRLVQSISFLSAERRCCSADYQIRKWRSRGAFLFFFCFLVEVPSSSFIHNQTLGFCHG
jgi:hypothetical protein